MFGNLRSKWNASRQRRFQEKVVKYLRMHFSEVLGPDERVLDDPDAIDKLYRKYFG